MRRLLPALLLALWAAPAAGAAPFPVGPARVPRQPVRRPRVTR